MDGRDEDNLERLIGLRAAYGQPIAHGMQLLALLLQTIIWLGKHRQQNA